MAKKRKRKKSTKISYKNITGKIVASCSILIIILIVIFLMNIFIYDNDLFKSQVNKTINYISFNDLFDTDTIKINNIKKLSDEKGKNIDATQLNIIGVDDNIEYEVILVPVNINIDSKYIKYYLTDEKGNTIKFDNLSNTSLSNEYFGNVIYTGTLNKNSCIYNLRVWIDNEYTGNDVDNAFEVKIKLK